MLTSIEQNTDISSFINYLSSSCKVTKLMDKTDALDMYLLVLCCNGYDFNSANVRNMQDRSIESYWRAIGKAVAMLQLFNVKLHDKIVQLIRGRETRGFQRFSNNIRLPNNTITQLSDQDRGLDLRQRSIHKSVINNPIVGTLVRGNTV